VNCITVGLLKKQYYILSVCLSLSLFLTHTHSKEQAAVPPYSSIFGLLLHPPLGVEHLCLGVSPWNLEKYLCQDTPLKI
jgi:hypothetical protein